MPSTYKSFVFPDHEFEPTISHTQDPCSTDSATAPGGGGGGGGSGGIGASVLYIPGSIDYIAYNPVPFARVI